MLMELHAHTKNSHRSKVYFDGVNTPEEVVRAAKRKGLGAIAITDHDTMNGTKNARKLGKKYDIIVIKGEEITTKSGHVVALGIEETIPKGLSVEETVDEIHKQGGIAVSVHPFDVRREGIGNLCTKCDVIEAFNAMNLERISNRKAKKVALKSRKPMVAGSDAHSINMIGYGITKVNADSLEKIFKEIKKHRTEIIGNYIPMSAITDLAIKRLQISYNYTYNYIQKNYCLPKKIIAKNLLKIVNFSPGKVDYILKGLTYIGLGAIFIYGFTKELKEIF